MSGWQVHHACGDSRRRLQFQVSSNGQRAKRQPSWGGREDSENDMRWRKWKRQPSGQQSRQRRLKKKKRRGCMPVRSSMLLQRRKFAQRAVPWLQLRKLKVRAAAAVHTTFVVIRLVPQPAFFFQLQLLRQKAMTGRTCACIRGMKRHQQGLRKNHIWVLMPSNILINCCISVQGLNILMCFYMLAGLREIMLITYSMPTQKGVIVLLPMRISFSWCWLNSGGTTPILSWQECLAYLCLLCRMYLLHG